MAYITGVNSYGLYYRGKQLSTLGYILVEQVTFISICSFLYNRLARNRNPSLTLTLTLTLHSLFCHNSFNASSSYSTHSNPKKQTLVENMGQMISSCIHPQAACSNSVSPFYADCQKLKPQEQQDAFYIRTHHQEFRVPCNPFSKKSLLFNTNFSFLAFVFEFSFWVLL